MFCLNEFRMTILLQFHKYYKEHVRYLNLSCRACVRGRTTDTDMLILLIFFQNKSSCSSFFTYQSSSFFIMNDASHYPPPLPTPLLLVMVWLSLSKNAEFSSHVCTYNAAYIFPLRQISGFGLAVKVRTHRFFSGYCNFWGHLLYEIASIFSLIFNFVLYCVCFFVQ